MYTDQCYGCPVRDGKVTHDIIVIVKPNLLIPTKDALSPREGRVAKQLLSTSIQQTIENMKEEEYRLKFRMDSLKTRHFQRSHHIRCCHKSAQQRRRLQNWRALQNLLQKLVVTSRHNKKDDFKTGGL